ncbi:MAG TPA: hypothetical protein VM686_16040, partial [Polyangiaceae bacterium]|nr:hypothetical protein [Polyangiaceae bacterium]
MTTVGAVAAVTTMTTMTTMTTVTTVGAVATVAGVMMVVRVGGAHGFTLAPGSGRFQSPEKRGKRGSISGAPGAAASG